MADSKLKDLTNEASPTLDDLIYLLNDPAGTPADRKAALSAVATLFAGSSTFTATFDPHTQQTAVPDAGEYVTPSRGATTTLTRIQDFAYWMLLPITGAWSLDRIGVEVTTGVAASTIRLGLYEVTAEGRPGALIVDAGTVDCTSNGLAEATISETGEGAVFLCAVRQGSGSPTVRVTGGTNHFARYSRTSGAVVTGFNLDCYTAASVSGALPDPAPTVIGDVSATLVTVRFA